MLLNKLLILFTFVSIHFIGISQKQFTIESSIDTIDFYDAIYDLQLKQDSVFYEDSLYLVRQTCSGEWGGSIWFKNKQTQIEYSCNATCPKSVNYYKGKYYVTTSLVHLVSSSEILEISQPDSMSVFEVSEMVATMRKHKIYSDGDFESISRQGALTLVDTTGALIVASFVQNDKFYHIVRDYNHLYLSEISNGKLSTIQKISEESMFNTELMKTEYGELVILFNSKYSKGYLKIEDSKIILKRFK